MIQLKQQEFTRSEPPRARNGGRRFPVKGAADFFARCPLSATQSPPPLSGSPLLLPRRRCRRRRRCADSFSHIVLPSPSHPLPVALCRHGTRGGPTLTLVLIWSSFGSGAPQEGPTKIWGAQTELRISDLTFVGLPTSTPNGKGSKDPFFRRRHYSPL